MCSNFCGVRGVKLENLVIRTKGQNCSSFVLVYQYNADTIGLSLQDSKQLAKNNIIYNYIIWLESHILHQ